MKQFVLSLFLLAILPVSHAQQTNLGDSLIFRTLTKEDMQTDFRYLRKILEETHPALYRYTSKSNMQQKMDGIYNILDHAMPLYDYYKLLAAFITDIRCAHTSITPTKDFGQYVRHGIKMIPLEIFPINGRLYISAIGSMDTTIRSGDEILSINGREPGNILDQTKRHMWADGYIETSKIAQMGGIRFGIWYYLMVERTDSFHLNLRTLQGLLKQVTIPALNANIFLPNFFKNPVNKAIIAANKERNKKEQKHGWRLEMADAPNSAILRINGFGGGKNGKEAAQIMRTFMDKNMTTLKKKKIQNLIVDLRNNGGGWDIQGVELFTYLMKDTTPMRYYRRKHAIVNDTTEYLKFSDLSPEDRANVKNELQPESDGTFTIREEYNDDLKLQYPKPNRFTGNLYFLINGGSGSTTSEFIAVAYSHSLGKFIGEESGGAYEGDNGGSFLHFELPKSGISAGTPLLWYDNGVKPPVQKGHGVIPDYPVGPNIGDIIKGKDTALEFTLKLIRDQR